MSLDSDIYEGFVGIFEAFNDSLSPPLPVIYQGVGGIPPDEGTWFEIRHFPNQNENYGLGNGGPTVHKGFFQVAVCERPGGGIVNGLEMAGAIVEAFGKGTIAGLARVEIKPWVMAPVEMPDRMMHVVRVPYVARVAN